MYLTYRQHSILITKQSDPHLSLQISYQHLQIRQVKSQPSPIALKFDVLLGLKRIGNRAILIIGQQSEYVTSVGLSELNQIKKIGWIAVAPEGEQNQILAELSDILEQIGQIFSNGLHYYSSLYDISLPYRYNKIQQANQTIRSYYDQFLWNLNLANMDSQPNITQANHFRKYCVKIIQGFVKEFTGILPTGNKFKFIIISRRSTKKAGTRFYARGIDDEGNVANFVETEQIMEIGSLLFLHTQIRGSVPAFFAQTGVNGLAGDLILQRTAQMNLPAFNKHFQMTRDIYCRIFAVNLLSEKKTQQVRLSTFYEQLVDTAKLAYVRYQFYDFHQECKNNKFQNSEQLISNLDSITKAFGFTCYDASKGVFLKEQTGVFRTNCLDCLDRTNYVQSRLALRALKNFLIQFGGAKTAQSIKQGLLQLPVNTEFPLLGGFNSVWADNGDSISLLYTGIFSTHTDITRTGERTFTGSVNHKFRSLMRFYTQFTDHRKQSGINLILNPSLPRKNAYEIHDFHTALTISIEIREDEEQILQHLLKYLSKQRPSIVVYFVFSTHEESWMNKLKCMFNGEDRQIKQWLTALTDFSEAHKYLLAGSLQSETGWLGVFCRQQSSEGISDIKKQMLTLKAGISPAFLFKLKLGSSSFIFSAVNCGSLEQFLQVFDEIHQNGFQVSKLGVFKSSSMFEADYRIIFGNTGAKLCLSQKQIQRLKQNLEQAQSKKNFQAEGSILGQLLDVDELNMDEIRYRNKHIRQYSEGPVQFVPTGNRLLFWNEQGAVLRVRQYCKVGKDGIKALLDYEIGRSQSGLKK